jgi:hypothetical protein
LYVLCGRQDVGVLQILANDVPLDSGALPQGLLTLDTLRGFGLSGDGGRAGPAPANIGGDVRLCQRMVSVIVPVPRVAVSLAREAFTRLRFLCIVHYPVLWSTSLSQ